MNSRGARGRGGLSNLVNQDLIKNRSEENPIESNESVFNS